MTVYIQNKDVPQDGDRLLGDGYTPCTLATVGEFGCDLIGDGWAIGGFGGHIYNESGVEYSKEELKRLLLLEEAEGLYEKLDDAGMLDDIKELDAVAAIAFVVMAESGQIDDVTATEHASVFSEWVEGVQYKAGDIRRYLDKLYRCLQGHTSQADWTPDVTPSLWKEVGDPTAEWPEWSQPIGAGDAYMKGDKVSHNGRHWTSLIDHNVWEPGTVGTESLWQLSDS